MDQSDKVALELKRQQQLLQARLSGEKQGDRWTKSDEKTTAGRLSSIATSERYGLGYDDDDREVQHYHTDMHLVVDNLLPLVRDLVKFGKQIDQYYGTTARNDTDVATWDDLTFEVLAAVARLATSIDEWSTVNKMRGGYTGRLVPADALLAQKVHLLVSVRLPRITKLSAAVSQQRWQLNTEHDNDGARNEPKPVLLQEAATTTLDKLPALVEEELAPFMGQLRDKMCEQMQVIVRDAVRSELERQQRKQEETAEV